MPRFMPYAIVPLVLGAVLLVVALASGGSDPTASAASTARIGSARTKLGTVLVDGRGRTLYLFEQDKRNTSTCNGTCATIWPAAGKAVAGRGVSAGKLGVTKRRDGKRQATYAGHPLYTYAGDSKRGQTAGQGLDQFGAEWYVVAPSGRKIDGD
jgi:predicted lipoprotein with Yx(FWY)xxD motif